MNHVRKSIYKVNVYYQHQNELMSKKLFGSLRVLNLHILKREHNTLQPTKRILL